MPTDAPASFHVMAKPTGAVCNLACGYCFFLNKDLLYPGSSFRMSDEVLAEYLDQYMRAQQVPVCNVSWQGGEPTLMGLGFFERSVELSRAKAPPGMRLEYSIQTNGTMLDDAWCEFFRGNEFLVGLSMDGPRDLHDRYRVDRHGRPTFDRTLRAARLMRRHGVEFNILCAVNSANVSHAVEVYRFFLDELGASWIQFIPVVERVNSDGSTMRQEGTTVTERSVAPAQWGEFLIGVFEEWIRGDVGEVHVNFFESAFASFLGVPALMCIFQETCGEAMVLEHNGDLYSCDHFVEPGHLLGNIMERPMSELAASDRQVQFGEAKLSTLPGHCLSCDVRFACNGECPKNRFRLAPDGEPGLNYLCAGYRAFFEHVDGPMRRMAELYRAGRSPAEITDPVSDEDSQTTQVFASAGRNDPCPCGSGKKFKYCHGVSR
jgi:uncharacterized protein